MRPSIVAAVVVTCALMVVGCSKESSGYTASATTTSATPTPASAPKEWVAVYFVSPYSDAQQQEFVDAAGQHIFEGPVMCFEGLAARAGIDGDATVLALVADTEDAVRAAGERVKGTPGLVAEFPSNCRD